MTSEIIVQLVIGVFGVSGVAGAIIALLKLKPEANSLAVTQLEASNKQLEEERDYWRKEAMDLRAQLTEKPRRGR